MTAEVIQIFHINTKVKLNNGKANLEFELIVHENAPKLLENVAFLEISVLDSEEHFIANASCKMREETILESIIIHPHLWQGPLDPYVYKLQANIRIDEKIISKYDTLLPIRTIEMKEESGILLNEKQFPFQGVNYVPRVLDHKVKYSEFLEDLHYFRQLYINAVILEYKNDSLEQWLLKEGILVIHTTKFSDTIPYLYETTKDSQGLINSKNAIKKKEFYKYQAKWLPYAFVYLVPPKKEQIKNGKISLEVYSNQKKLAIYLDGLLYEFKEGDLEYQIDDIPVERAQVIFTIQAGEATTSYTLIQE